MSGGSLLRTWNPSAAGAKPKTSNAASGKLSCLTVVIHKQVGRLIQPYAVQSGNIQLGLKPLPDGHRKIFCGRNAVPKFLYLFIQEPMVYCLDHLTVHDVLELFQVHHKAGALVNLSFDRHLERVIVAVAVRVIAFAEEAPVLLRGKLRVVIVVRSGKLGFSCQIHHVGSSLCAWFRLYVSSDIGLVPYIWMNDPLYGFRKYVRPFQLTVPRTCE